MNCGGLEKFQKHLQNFTCLLYFILRLYYVWLHIVLIKIYIVNKPLFGFAMVTAIEFNYEYVESSVDKKTSANSIVVSEYKHA